MELPFREMPNNIQKMLTAANEIMMDVGPQGLTIAGVSEKSGLDIKKIEAQFPTVNKIIEELVSRDIEFTSDLFIKTMNDRGKADIKLSRLVKELLNHYENSFPILKLVTFAGDPTEMDGVFYSQVIRREHIERYRQNTAVLARLIAQGQSEGLFTEIDPLEAAYLLRGMVSFSIKYRSMLKENVDERNDHADVIVRVLLKGLLR